MKKPPNEDLIRGDIKVFETTMSVELWYPRAAPGSIDTIEVGLCDVRAADSIRISYDFERDGYAIKQASTFQWEQGDTVCDADWQEVAFVQAWAREKEDGK